jgi:nucleoid DNA-binding protein
VKLRDITRDVGDKLDLPATTVARVLDATLALVLEHLVREGRVDWRGFGTFSVRAYPGRKIHNPATGKTITLPPRRSIAFKPSKVLRSRLKPTARPTRRPSRTPARRAG